jgi:hypothetical protein
MHSAYQPPRRALLVGTNAADPVEVGEASLDGIRSGHLW